MPPEMTAVAARCIRESEDARDRKLDIVAGEVGGSGGGGGVSPKFWSAEIVVQL